MYSKRLFLLLYFFAIIIFITHFFILKTAVYGDGRYYYSYLPSLLIENSFDFTNSFKSLNITYFLTPLGLPANIYPIGPAIIWTVPFLFSHFILFPFGINDGYNFFYQIIIGAWNIGLVILGLFFLQKTLAKFVSEKIAFASTITTFFATNLLFYGAVDVINSHSSSFFLSSLFLYLWIHNKSTFLIGVVLGILALVRPQDALLIIFPFSTLLILKQKYLMKFLTLCISSVIIFSPQLFIWKNTWGNWYVNPYLNVETFNFLSPQIFGVLFNKGNGLFLWTPILIFAFLGLIKFTSKYRKIGFPALIFFSSQLYLISSWSIWWQGASYSGRMFISSLPILSIGLAYFFSLKRIKKFRLSIAVFFSLLNFFLIIYFLLNN